MPAYDYLCNHCGFSFEKFLPANKHQKKISCEGCGEMAEQVVPEDLEVTFDVKTEGLEAQNTGVASVDYNFDYVIGNDSEKQWRYIEGREAYKRDKIKDRPAARIRDLVNTPKGDYFVWDIGHKRQSGALRTLFEKSRRK